MANIQYLKEIGNVFDVIYAKIYTQKKAIPNEIAFFIL